MAKHTKSKPKPKPKSKPLALRSAHMYVHITVHYCSTQHRTVLIIFPLIIQTITIAQILSTEGKGDTTQKTNNQEPNSSIQL